MPQEKKKRALTTAEADYTQFLKSIEPITIALIKSRFRVDRDQYFTERPRRLSIAWHCTPVDVGSSHFEANAEIFVKLGSSSKSKPSVEVEATFQMHIHAAKPIDRRFVDRFAESDVGILIWPFFREYVSSVSGRMHIPPIILPVVIRTLEA